MQILKFITAALVALAMAAPGHAALLVKTQGSPANLVDDYSADGLASFNLDFHNDTATRLTFVLEEADLAGPLGLSAMVLNMSGMPFRHFMFAVDGISFLDALGSVSPAFGSVGSMSVTERHVGISFANPEPAEFRFGNPLLEAGLSDWLLDTRGLRAGDVFVVTAFVPEPSTVALMLPLLGLLAAARRKAG